MARVYRLECLPPTDTLTARKVKKIVYVARVYCGENGDGHCPYLLPLLNTPVNYAVRTVTVVLFG